MKTKTAIVSLCFLLIPIAIHAQDKTEPEAKVSKDIPFAVVSFNRLAVDLKRPVYPDASIAANVTGRVELWIEVDEKGAVTSARAVSGPEQLRDASVAAARASKFKPFEFQGKIYKAVGPFAFYFPESKEKEHLESIKMSLLAEWINSGILGIPFLTESWIKEVDAIDPSIVKEVLNSVKDGGLGGMTAFTDGVSARLEKRMTGDKLWYFQFGKKMGKLLFVQLTEGSEAELRARLADVREHAKAMPPNFPMYAGSKLKSLLALLDDMHRTGEEFKRELERTASGVRQYLGGELPKQANGN